MDYNETKLTLLKGLAAYARYSDSKKHAGVFFIAFLHFLDLSVFLQAFASALAFFTALFAAAFLGLHMPHALGQLVRISPSQYSVVP